jgi:magnesium-transporting ATPase (P-type)
VPADVKLFSAKGLCANEISLTGESEPVKKVAGPAGEHAKQEVIKRGLLQKTTFEKHF